MQKASRRPYLCRMRGQPAQAGRVTSAVLLLGASVTMLALNLRIGITAVGPVLPAIVHDLGTGLVYGSLLTTLPVVMMGVAAPLSAHLAARVGVERLVTASLFLIGLATLARVWSASPIPLLATALAVGAGIAVGNTMLPALVRTYFAEHAALVTGVYIVAINVGAGAAALGTPRLESALRITWPGALALWSAVALAAAILWLGVSVRMGTRPRSFGGALPWRARRAWLMMLFFGVQSMVFYAVFAWLAPLYEERGWTGDRAGLLLSFFSVCQVAGTIAVSLWVQRTKSLAAASRLTIATIMLGLVLVALTPASLPWLWVALLGLGSGGIFPVSLLLPLIATTSADEARRWTALMLCYGYLLGAAGPFVVAVVRSATGSFTPAYLTLAAASGSLLALTPLVTRSTGNFTSSPADTTIL